jgi:hypothetical protein
MADMAESVLRTLIELLASPVGRLVWPTVAFGLGWQCFLGAKTHPYRSQATLRAVNGWLYDGKHETMAARVNNLIAKRQTRCWVGATASALNIVFWIVFVLVSDPRETALNPWRATLSVFIVGSFILLLTFDGLKSATTSEIEASLAAGKSA